MNKKRIVTMMIGRYCWTGLLACLLYALCPYASGAQTTETLYLSGTGLGHTVTWDFYCSKGMNSGRWSRIEVPSQWELQGFGAYTYGRFYLNEGAKPADEWGLYRYRFDVPRQWEGRQVNIVFEGVMTDTEVRVNGRLAGAKHQGGFYRFVYDITDKLHFKGKNRLEVKVWKESANRSVNAAERRADWWLFGGIYRPVYLEAVPRTHIERVAVDATAEGSLSARIHFRNLPKQCALRTELLTVDGNVSQGKRLSRLNGDTCQTVTTQWKGVRPWDCEHPNLYKLRLELLDASQRVLHVHEERIGFRTVEFRPKDGIYVNGTKIVLKGINRHCFHPDGGRTTNRDISLQDAKLIKAMNMNAVRSHYPPDKHFLEVCDSLGLFYLEEFAGWHGAYNDTTAARLLPEMLARDVNHPCVFMWSNGNEGGWNERMDKCFADYDPQGRHVVHPWADFDGLDTHHYPAYQTGTYRLANGYRVFMPTEFLHGQYDKGLGSGLDDYWANYTESPLFAGGFLWTFVDEAVRRTDKDGMLDSDGPNGPDGIVGPYREKEGSFYTVREVWAPIQFKKLYITPSFKGDFLVTNAYLFSNLKECRMKYRLHALPSPLRQDTATVLAQGEVMLPPLEPGETGKARMILPDCFFQGDVLELIAYDARGEVIGNWTWPVHYASGYFARQYDFPVSGQVTRIEQSGNQVILSAGKASATFDNRTGLLTRVMSGGAIVPFGDGPLPVGMKAEFVDGQVRYEGSDALYVAYYRGAVDSIVWRMTPAGLLGMDALILNRENGGGFNGVFYDKKVYNFGLTFSYPERQAKGMRWMGRGPYRVWKNRIKGTNYGIWEKAYNNTVTGEDFEHLVYPEFKGYHANLYWATLESEDASFTVYSETDGLYFRVFTPQEPKNRRNGENSMWKFPEGDLSFLLDIPAMRSFKPVTELGPHSQPSSIRIKRGDEGLHIKLWFDFSRH